MLNKMLLIIPELGSNNPLKIETDAKAGMIKGKNRMTRKMPIPGNFPLSKSAANIANVSTRTPEKKAKINEFPNDFKKDVSYKNTFI